MQCAREPARGPDGKRIEDAPLRSAQEEEWRRDHGESDVLRHVPRERAIGERIERRTEDQRQSARAACQGDVSSQPSRDVHGPFIPVKDRIHARCKAPSPA